MATATKLTTGLKQHDDSPISVRIVFSMIPPPWDFETLWTNTFDGILDILKDENEKRQGLLTNGYPGDDFFDTLTPSECFETFIKEDLWCMHEVQPWPLATWNQRCDVHINKFDFANYNGYQDLEVIVELDEALDSTA